MNRLLLQLRLLILFLLFVLLLLVLVFLLLLQLQEELLIMGVFIERLLRELLDDLVGDGFGYLEIDSVDESDLLLLLEDTQLALLRITHPEHFHDCVYISRNEFIA